MTKSNTLASPPYQLPQGHLAAFPKSYHDWEISTPALMPIIPSSSDLTQVGGLSLIPPGLTKKPEEPWLFPSLPFDDTLSFLTSTY